MFESIKDWWCTWNILVQQKRLERGFLYAIKVYYLDRSRSAESLRQEVQRSKAIGFYGSYEAGIQKALNTVICKSEGN